MGRKFGFSFSARRALGISAMKGRISRKIGIPLTKSGRQRKAGRLLGVFGIPFLLGSLKPASRRMKMVQAGTVVRAQGLISQFFRLVAIIVALTMIGFACMVGYLMVNKP